VKGETSVQGREERALNTRELQKCHKVEAPITNRGPIADFIFKCHTFLRYVSIKSIDSCLKLKLSRIGCSILPQVSIS
jgi:hypothetical protein